MYTNAYELGNVLLHVNNIPARPILIPQLALNNSNVQPSNLKINTEILAYFLPLVGTLVMQNPALIKQAVEELGLDFSKVEEAQTKLRS